VIKGKRKGAKGAGASTKKKKAPAPEEGKGMRRLDRCLK